MDKHWIYRYLGKPFIEGKYDCLDLVIEILKNEYNKETILFSNYEDTTLEKHKLSAFLVKKYFREVSTPFDGCVAVMTWSGYRTGHIGIYYIYRGTGQIIHLGSVGAVTCKANKIQTQQIELVRYVDFKSII